MGFLDHSTNNIIIDAVLTDRGRQLLAANDGTFTIVRYAFGDDEVDYSIIKKFGRTIGKEKIEKNTPVFEAQTSAQLGLRHQICSYNDPNLIALPQLRVIGGSVGQVSSQTTQPVTIEQFITSENITVSQRSLLQESTYRVEMDERFLRLENISASPLHGSFSNRVVYDMSRSTVGTGDILSTVNFILKWQSNGSSYPAELDSSNIARTNVRVVGVTTGIDITFEVQVKY